MGDGWARAAVALVLLPSLACSGGETPGGSEPPATPPAESAPGVTPEGEVLLLRGMMVYLADAPRFTECGTGASAVMAQEGDYLTAERAYLDAGAQGEPLLVTFEGRLTRRPGMEGGDVDAVVVTRFLGAEPGQGCGEEPVVAGLEGTEWRLVALPDGADVPDGVTATLLLDPDPRRASGSTGCNRFTGTYDLDGGRLIVSLTALTRMACPEPVASLEADFLEALRSSVAYRFTGAFLELLGEVGSVARFAATEG